MIRDKRQPIMASHFSLVTSDLSLLTYLRPTPSATASASTSSPRTPPERFQQTSSPPPSHAALSRQPPVPSLPPPVVQSSIVDHQSSIPRDTRFEFRTIPALTCILGADPVYSTAAGRHPSKRRRYVKKRRQPRKSTGHRFGSLF